MGSAYSPPRAGPGPGGEPKTTGLLASPTRRREQKPVQTVESRAFHLTLQDLQLVSEHQEIDVLLTPLATSGSEAAANEEVEEREQQQAPSGREARMLPVPLGA